MTEDDAILNYHSRHRTSTGPTGLVRISFIETISLDTKVLEG